MRNQTRWKDWKGTCFLAGGMVFGGVAPAEEWKTWELAPLEVIGEEERLFELPGSGYRVDGPMMEAYRLTDLNRLLARVPGVYFREEDGFGLLANISLRGVDTSRSAKLTLMEDGIPTAPAPYSAPAAYYTPTLGRMSGIEVLKGTSQVRFGPHTTGGVINYLSTPLPGRRAGYLKLSGGTDGELQAHGWLGDRRTLENGGHLDVLVEGYYRENDGFMRIAPAGDYNGSDETGFERTDTMLKLGWGTADGRHRLELKAGGSELEADLSYLGVSDEDFEANPYRRYAASREDVFNTEHRRSYLRYGYRISEDWALSFTGYYNTFHRNWYKLNDIRDLDIDGDGVPDGTGMGLSQAVAGGGSGAGLAALKGERAAVFRVRANNRDYYLAGSEVTLEGFLENGAWDHNPTIGLRYHNDRIRRFQWHDRYAQSADGSWSAPERSVPGSDGNRRQHTSSFALFAEDEIRRGPWVIRPGLRYEFIDQSTREFSRDGGNIPGPEQTGSMELWSGGLAATYLLDADRALFFNLYRGFSVPDPRSAIVNGIDEEISNSAEAGFRYRNPESGLSTEVVAFLTHYEDLIVIDNIGSGAAGSGDLQGVTENVGEVESYGLEFLVHGDLAGGHGNGWRLPASFTATWTVAELVGGSLSTDAESIFAGGTDGSRLPYIPEWSLNLSLGLETEKWSTGLSASWRDRTWSTASESSEPVNPITGSPDARYGQIDPVFLLDWNFHYTVNDHLGLFATVSNLLDETHLASRHPHGPRPGAPRQVVAGLTLAY